MCRRSIFPIFPLILFILWMFIPQAVFAQDATSTPASLTPISKGAETPTPTLNSQVGIFAPKNGSVLRGDVTISGTTAGAWVLTFSYADNSFETWFPLAQSANPVSNGTLATWDTTSVTDGLYILRLSILSAQVKRDFMIKVRVSNTTPIETDTPAPMLILTTIPSATLMITSTSLSTAETATMATALITSVDGTTDLAILTSIALRTALPLTLTNPAALDPNDIFINLGKGILAVVAVYALVGLIFFLRRK